MRMLWPALLCLAFAAHADEARDRTTIEKAVAAFNDPHLRATVLSDGADLDDLERYRGPETSQVYFKVTRVRMVTADVAIADATGSQYGTMIMKRTIAALFVFRREGETWRIVAVRGAGRDWLPRP